MNRVERPRAHIASAGRALTRTLKADRVIALMAALFLVEPRAAAQDVARVPDRQLAQNICSAVEAQTLEAKPRRDDVMYQYETLIADAAGVTSTDSEAMYGRKTRDWLNANMSRLLCDQYNFRPYLGNLLKLAISTRASPFIDQVLGQWRIDLNQIDKADGETVLDYIERKRIEAGSNGVLVRAYTQYYDRFRAAGARRARELKR